MERIRNSAEAEKGTCSSGIGGSLYGGTSREGGRFVLGSRLAAAVRFFLAVGFIFLAVGLITALVTGLFADGLRADEGDSLLPVAESDEVPAVIAAEKTKTEAEAPLADKGSADKEAVDQESEDNSPSADNSQPGGNSSLANRTPSVPSAEKPAPVKEQSNFTAVPAEEAPHTGEKPENTSAGKKNPIRVERGITFWLTGEDGNWKIPLPNWSMNDILKLIDTPNKRNEESSYTIESLSAHGRVDDETVELTTEYRVITAGKKTVRVPLGLNEGVYIPQGNGANQEMFQYSGPGECRLDIDRKTGGYVAVIRNIDPNSSGSGNGTEIKKAKDSSPQPADAGTEETESENTEAEAPAENEASANAPKQADSMESPLSDAGQRVRHTITLRLFFKTIKTARNESQLIATFAPAVSSRVQLEVPLSDIQILVSEGTMAMAPVSLNETTSEIVLSGLNRNGKPTEISWWKEETRQDDAEKIQQVEDGSITITPDDQQVQYDVTYPIRCFGGGTDTIRIRLPDRARLLRDSVVVTGTGSTPVTVREINETVSGAEEASTGGNKPAGFPILEIRLAQETEDTVVVQFKATAQNPKYDPALAESAAEWELGGFSVLGAKKQYGRMTVRLPKEIGLQLTPGAGIRTTASGTEPIDEESETFSFFAQPFSLLARSILRQARTSVTPEYLIQVHSGHIHLDARMLYTVHGGMIHELRLKCADWFVSEVKPENVVDTEKMYTDPQTGELVLPLLVPSEGPVPITLSASRDFVLYQEQLELPIPIPAADWVEPAPVVIVPDDNLELTPAAGRIVDLMPKGLRSLNRVMEIPPRQQAPLVYQVKRFSLKENGHYPIFAATMTVHEQQIETAVETEIQLTDVPKTNQIRQTFTYRIAYEPLKGVSLAVPAELKENSAFTLTLDEKTIPVQNITTEPLEEPNSGRVRKKILFPDGERIGTCSLTIQYPCRTVELLPDRTNRVTLDLVLPEDGTQTAHRLTVKTNPGVLIETSDSENSIWKGDESRSPLSGSLREYHFSTDQKAEQIPLNAVVRAQDALGTTVVERLWIQTYLAAGNRFDRISARIVSDRDHFLIKLPPQVRAERTEIRLDGKVYPPQERNEEIYTPTGEILVRLSEEQKRRGVILEITYLIQPDAASNSGSIILPEFTGPSVWVQRCYWQVILPVSRHIVGSVRGWTPEYYDTSWSGFVFKRLASMGQEELSAWIGIPSPERIADETNVYLFGSFSPNSEVKIRLVDRAVLILIGSGILLLFGLGFLYFPVTRYQGMLLFLILIVIAVLAYRPIVILVFLQTTVFGVILTLLALGMKSFFGRKTPAASEPEPEPVLPLDLPRKNSTASHSTNWQTEKSDSKSQIPNGPA